MLRLRLAGVTKVLTLPLSRRTRSLLERVRQNLASELKLREREPTIPAIDPLELENDEARIERLLDHESSEVTRLTNDAVYMLMRRAPGIKPRVAFRASPMEVSSSGRIAARLLAKLRLETWQVRGQQD